VGAVGRLENIIARNRRPVGARATFTLVWRGLFLLFILGALVFTDWALTDDDGGGGDARAIQPVARPRPDEHRVDGVHVLRPRARAAGSAAAAPVPALAPAAPAP
jgi:hypothetical protein